MRYPLLVGGALLALALFGVVTLIALEGGEVVVLHTRGSDGETHDTRTWIADEQGIAYVEAANPERPFYRHILQNPRVELTRRGETRRCLASVMPQPAGHELIRSLLRRKYGWADRWIGLVADTSDSLAIRLEPQ